jgi:hypothetical protein
MSKVATSATSSVPTQSATPETPEQKRIRLQKAAQQNIDKTAVPSSKSSSTVSRKSTPSVDDVINPKYTPGPMPDGFTQINLFRPGVEPQIRYVHKSRLQSWLQNGWKQGVGDGSATWTDQAAQTRQQKQASAAQSAQAGMTPKPVSKPAVWRSGRNPDAPATTSLENKAFAKLNKIFESILNVSEASASDASEASTSELIIANFINLMNAPYAFSLDNTETLPIIQKFAKEIEDTYTIDGGKKAIEELGEWAWDTMTKLEHQRRLSRSSLGSNNKPSIPAQVSTASAEPTINSDGSITISGATGQAPAKIMTGDPMYKQFAAAINNQLSK